MNLFKADIIVNILNSLGWTLIHSIWQGLLLLVFFLLLIILFKHRSIQFKYFIGLVSLSVFLGAVIATFIITFNNHNSLTLSQPEISGTHSALLTDSPGHETAMVRPSGNDTDKTFKEFSQIVEKLCFYINKWSVIIAIIWLVCVLALLVNHLVGFYKIKRLVNNPVNQRSARWQLSIRRICSYIRLNKKIDLLISPYINSPFVFGIIKPVILFPLKLVTGLSEEEVVSILTHELAHIKRNDQLVNVFQIFMESVFFYQPGVWYISKHLRAQREIICDAKAGELCKNKRTYVNALVKIEELRLEPGQFAVAAKKNKNELLSRIKYLLSDQAVKTENKRSFNPAPLLIALMVFLSFSFVAFKNTTGKNYIQQKYFNTAVEKYLDPAKSSIVVYDTKNKEYLIYNDSIGRRRYVPVSTFKVASTLFALESGVAKDINFTIPWDSVKYPEEPWMRNAEPQKYWFWDQNLQSALKYSVNWFYFELHKLIGKETIQKYITQCHYGNGKTGSSPDNFWFDGSLRISALEQVDFLNKLYTGSLNGFSRRSQEETVRIMLDESAPNYKIYGKTGTGKLIDHQVLCWYIGILETHDNTYVFAFNTFVNGYNKMPTDKRIEVIKHIFHDLHKITI